MDLHTWITQQVASAERTARQARDDVPALLASGDIDNPFAERHIACHGPTAALRRCETDRRILARHNVDPDAASSDMFATACHGCGTFGYCDDPVTENLNDCPELLDLAHAHGITEQILTGLDRPQPPEPKAHAKVAHMPAWARLIATTPITTSQVPAALRGPRWKP